MSDTESPASPPTVWRMLTESGRFLRYAVLRFSEDRCTQAAAALTYTSLLALVPMLTIVIGMFSAFQAFADLEATAKQLIFDNLVPEVGTAVQDYLERFVGNARQLTGAGIAGLMVTAILLLATIESAFNAIWRVRESRPWLLRLLSFWAILTLTPIMFAVSLAVTRQFVSTSEIGSQVLSFEPLVGLMPGFIGFLTFTALYGIIPNRPILLRDAAAGGLVAAVLLELSKSGFAAYLKTFPVYETIYGALSTFPIFLVWLYVAWSIVLIGALVAAALPDWRANRLFSSTGGAMTPSQYALLGFAVVQELAHAARSGVGMKSRKLIKRLPVQLALLEDTLKALRHARFVERTENDRWVLSRDPNSATLHDLLMALGIGLSETDHAVPGLKAHERRVESLLKAAEQGQKKALDVPLSELFVENGEAPAAPVRLDKRAGADG